MCESEAINCVAQHAGLMPIVGTAVQTVMDQFGFRIGTDFTREFLNLKQEQIPSWRDSKRVLDHPDLQHRDVLVSLVHGLDDIRKNVGYALQHTLVSRIKSKLEVLLNINQANKLRNRAKGDSKGGKGKGNPKGNPKGGSRPNGQG